MKFKSLAPSTTLLRHILCTFGLVGGRASASSELSGCTTILTLGFGLNTTMMFAGASYVQAESYISQKSRLTKKLFQIMHRNVINGLTCRATNLSKNNESVSKAKTTNWQHNNKSQTGNPHIHVRRRQHRPNNHRLWAKSVDKGL